MKEDGLNVLLNNAGKASESTGIDRLKSEHMIDVFTVNTVSPLMVTKVRWFGKCFRN